MWRIAIVDDERHVLQGMKRVIPWDELQAEWAWEALNGADGLEMTRLSQPDVIITDIYMPEMNGLDMIERIRQEGYNGKIIILSGYSDFEHARQALRYQVSDYVSKPISVPTLKAILTKVINELSEEEESRLRRLELEQTMVQYKPFIEKEWVRSAAIGTLERNRDGAAYLPEPYTYWTDCSHVTLGIDLVRKDWARTLSVSDWNLFRFAIGNIACEVARQGFPNMEYTELHSTRALLVLHPPSGAGQQEGMTQSLRGLGIQLIDSIKSCLKLEVRIGIGRFKEAWTDIPYSTDEAFQAIELKQERLSPGYELYRYPAEIRTEQPDAAPLLPAKFLYKLAGAVKASQELEAVQLISEYITELKASKDLITKDYVQLLGSELWGIVTYSLYESGLAVEELFSGDQIAKELMSLSEPDQLTEWLSGKIGAIIHDRQWKGSSKHRQIVDFMTRYIHEHYAEDVTLADLSDMVYISRNHLSIIFKNITGETFNTYLTRVRIEKARELLLERKMLVYEVAERVGYKNIPYFSTLFKKITGQNPTELIK
ncbi:AraC family transcriptional regulator [Paenibacillus yonginensis]|uniref:AraC family transcriptional regulator n=2 Tax=Paenibacillus TaxID=44249 RepID=A0A1B1N2U0_9BACL|nr:MULTISPECIES: response regulator [Paenibacillus]ANS75729.1 AraC family transcriptional regulator [Paenibacillus yonginensis]GGA48287.1 hypothetical protein GCM10010917_36940 [Paenibacillus physcomitrellae]